MKPIRLLTTTLIAAMLMGCTAQQPAPAVEDNTPGFVLSDEMTQVKISEDGALLVLKNNTA